MLVDIVFGAAFGCFALKRLLTFLHIYQQEEYDSLRFARWWWNARAFDRRAGITILICSLLAGMAVHYDVFFRDIVIVVFCWVAATEADPRRSAKKKLAMTARAGRIFWVAAGIVALTGIALLLLDAPINAWFFEVQLLPFALAAGNWVLTPFENKIQQSYWAEASAKLDKVKPFIIGVTGSFGKTSAKHILGHILSQSAPTLITPGSINTVMGISRVVRETLAPHHKYFICEMGAYGPGSIKKLCELAPPDAAVLTTIGQAHYERYKTLDAVARAKCELPEAAAKKGGWSVIGSDVLNFEYTRHFIEQHRKGVTLVGGREGDDLKILEILQTAEGLKVRLVWDFVPYTLYAPLFGTHHAVNMALAFAAAAKLGIFPELIIDALKSVPQIRHRLEVLKHANGSIVIDDAFNSNPSGFAAALSVLALLGRDKRKILVSPGMVELGLLHNAEHAQIGLIAAKDVDVFVAILPERIPTMIDAFKSKAPDKQVVPCANFAQAQKWLGENMKGDDVVLIENDLPDMYEKKLRL